MKHLMTRALCLGAGSLLLTVGASAQDISEGAALDGAMLEADWTSVATLTSLLGDASRLHTQSDAAGVCDGIKDGSYGCQTDGGPQAPLGRRHLPDASTILYRCPGRADSALVGWSQSVALAATRWAQERNQGRSATSRSPQARTSAAGSAWSKRLTKLASVSSTRASSAPAPAS